MKRKATTHVHKYKAFDNSVYHICQEGKVFVMLRLMLNESTYLLNGRKYLCKYGVCVCHG